LSDNPTSVDMTNKIEPMVAMTMYPQHSYDVQLEIARIRSEQSKKAWDTRRRREAKKRSQTAKKAWKTRKANARKHAKRSRASKKAWETIRKNEDKSKRRSEASKKAWQTRKANKPKTKTIKPIISPRQTIMRQRIEQSKK